MQAYKRKPKMLVQKSRNAKDKDSALKLIVVYRNRLGSELWWVNDLMKLLLTLYRWDGS